MEKKEKSFERVAVEVSVVTIIGNVILAVFKLFAGVFGKSAAMVSDAVHSFSDVFSTFIVIIGAKISAKKADKEHPFGHERMECVSAIILAVVLALTGIAIGVSAVESISTGAYLSAPTPAVITVIAAIISIVSKEAMYWYTRAAAKKINSVSLMASAWDHRSDALSSIGSLIGIVGARMGFPIADSIAAIVICCCIMYVSYTVFRDAMAKMVDKSCDDETEAKIRDIALSQTGVKGVGSLHTRLFGARVYVEVTVEIDETLHTNEACDIMKNVHDAIEKGLPIVKHCIVSPMPYDAGGAHINA